MKKITITIILGILLILTLNIASAMLIKSVEQEQILPGQEGIVTVLIENNLDHNIEDVSLSLNFDNSPFAAVGGSQKTVDKIKEDKTEDFSFKARAASDTKPGDYNVNYSLKYENITETGKIAIRVFGNPNLSFSVLTENPIIGGKGKVILKIINKGLADARFVNVKITPDGYTLIGSNEVYIGTVASDDFETATFDVIFNSQGNLNAIVEYKDFDNKDKVENIDLPLKVYTKEQAFQLGIITKSNTSYYVTGIIVLIVLYLVYRRLRKRSRMKKLNSGVGR